MSEKEKRLPRLELILLCVIILVCIISWILKYYTVEENFANFLIFFVLIPLVVVQAFIRVRSTRRRK